MTHPRSGQAHKRQTVLYLALALGGCAANSTGYDPFED